MLLRRIYVVIEAFRFCVKGIGCSATHHPATRGLWLCLYMVLGELLYNSLVFFLQSGSEQLKLNEAGVFREGAHWWLYWKSAGEDISEPVCPTTEPVIMGGWTNGQLPFIPPHRTRPFKYLLCTVCVTLKSFMSFRFDMSRWRPQSQSSLIAVISAVSTSGELCRNWCRALTVGTQQCCLWRK